MSKLDLVLLRDGLDGAVRHLAMQDFNLVLEGPQKIVNEAVLLAERDQFEKCLTNSVERPTTQALKQFGQALGQALFPGEINRLARNDATCRLSICCTDPELKRIPWEYLVWPGDNTAPRREKTIARVVPVTSGEDSQPVKLGSRKLRVALIVSDPSEMAAVPGDQVERDLRDTFSQYLAAQKIASDVELVTFVDITRGEIDKKLSQKAFDVIHFVGHGQADGLYMLTRTDRSADLVLVDAVISLFNRPTVQLILLSACSTGAQRRGADISTLTEELVVSGVPAVVGSQLPIPSSTIAIFCAALYQKLLESGDIDDAVAAGRAALQLELSTTNASAAIEWGIPVLYRRPGRSKLFRKSR